MYTSRHLSCTDVIEVNLKKYKKYILQTILTYILYYINSKKINNINASSPYLPVILSVLLRRQGLPLSLLFHSHTRYHFSTFYLFTCIYYIIIIVHLPLPSFVSSNITSRFITMRIALYLTVLLLVLVGMLPPLPHVISS